MAGIAASCLDLAAGPEGPVVCPLRSLVFDLLLLTVVVRSLVFDLEPLTVVVLAEPAGPVTPGCGLDCAIACGANAAIDATVTAVRRNVRDIASSRRGWSVNPMTFDCGCIAHRQHADQAAERDIVVPTLYLYRGAGASN